MTTASGNNIVIYSHEAMQNRKLDTEHKWYGVQFVLRVVIVIGGYLVH